MSEKPSRFELAPDASGADRRKETRYSAYASARIEGSRGEQTEAPLVDVSTHGCAVACTVDWLRMGTVVSIGLDDEPPLHAIIRWARGGSAGMEFLRPIPPERTKWHDLMESAFGT